MQKLIVAKFGTRANWAAVCLILLVIAGLAAAFGQDEEIFDTRTLETQLKWQYRLSPSEVRLLHPLIARENQHLVMAFFRFSAERSDDFMSLWDEVRISRGDFESSVDPALSRRQKQALRSVRTRIESRVLDLWTDDYIAVLDVQLELDQVQQSCIRRIFHDERSSRHRLIISEAQNAVRKDAEWQALLDQRERSLRELLDSDQMLEYLQMGQHDSGLMAAVWTKSSRPGH